jgi:hypothetical protein
MLTDDSAAPTASTLSTQDDLNDADLNTSVTGQLTTQFAFGLDFDTAKSYTQLRVYLNTGGATPTAWYNYAGYHDFSVYKSTNNSTWTLVKTFASPTIITPGDSSNHFHVELDLDGPETTRYVKVLVDTAGLATNPSGQYSLACEVAAFVSGSTIGSDGDYYLNITNGDVYKKAGGIWGLIGNIEGAAGSSGSSGLTGSSGTSGIDGTSGTSGINGSSGTSGVDGTSGTSGLGSSGSSGTSGAGGASIDILQVQVFL